MAQEIILRYSALFLDKICAHLIVDPGRIRFYNLYTKTGGGQRRPAALLPRFAAGPATPAAWRRALEQGERHMKKEETL